MRNLYLGGIEAEKRREFNEILEDLQNRKDVYIVSLPKEQYNIVVMKLASNNFNDRVPTGEEFISYDFCFVTFLYQGVLVSINPSTYYPFTDENNPGKWNYVTYSVVGLNKKIQGSYSREYTSIDDIDTGYRKLRYTHEQYINIDVNNYMTAVKNIVNKYGGYREKSIIEKCLLEKGDTWNDEHKVINVISIDMEEDGHMDSFSIDIVTGKICG